MGMAKAWRRRSALVLLGALLGGYRDLAQELQPEAVLDADSIRLRLPLAKRALAGAELQARLVAPTGESGETVRQAVRAGERAAVLRLPYPRKTNGDRVSLLEWWRVMYRLQASEQPVAEGIASLSEIAPRMVQLTVTRPKVWREAAYELRVLAVHPGTLAPVGNAAVAASMAWETGAGKVKKVVRRAVSDAQGMAVLSFAASRRQPPPLRARVTVSVFVGSRWNRVEVSRQEGEIPAQVEEDLIRHDPKAEEIAESNADRVGRGQLAAAMAGQLEPLGRVLEAAGLGRLTTEREPIERLAAEQKVDLNDAWGRPYRARAEVVEGRDVLSFVSAGPDQRFGTADDFVLPGARQSLFATPGRELDRMLREAAEAGGTLPETEVELLAFARERGLDLAALRDPQGRPFVYTVEWTGRTMEVTVALVRDPAEGPSRGILWRTAVIAPPEAGKTMDAQRGGPSAEVPQ